jgi:zinc-ribbon family
MLFIFGKRYARVGRFIDTEHICYPCKAYDREILVYRPYFHFCFIPVFPIGRNEYSMHCRNCGDETMLDSVIHQYQEKLRTPFYLYSVWILFAAIALTWFFWNSNSKKHKIEYVEKPLTGDVYTISKEESDGTRYYFLRIIEVGNDSVRAFRNDLDYGGFVSSFSRDDYFVKDDTLVISRKKLKRLLADEEILSIDRGYGEGSDFNRIR